MAPISRLVRAEAIEFLLATDDAGLGFSRGAIEHGTSTAAVFLASAAWDAVYSVMQPASLNIGNADEWTEAAALLRDGWCPGDPVVLLGGAK